MYCIILLSRYFHLLEISKKIIYFVKEISKMKKKTIGRFAAAGLAAASAVSAMGIAASADLTYSATANPDIQTVTGTVYWVEWLVQKTTYAFNVDSYITTDPTDSTKLVYKDVGPSSTIGPNVLSSGVIYDGATGTEARGAGYYATKTQAENAYKTTQATIDSANRDEEDAVKKFKNECSIYVQWNNLKAAAEKVTKVTSVGTFKDAKGNSVQVYGDGAENVLYYLNGNASPTSSYDVPTKPSSLTDMNVYAWATKPNPRSEDVRTLKTTLGYTINIDTTGKISAIGNYVIGDGAPSTSGDTNTGSQTQTQTGSYIVPSAYRTAGDLSYLGANGYWYPNQSALLVATGSAVAVATKAPTPAYSSTYCYFDPVTGNYTSSATGYAYAVSGTRTENAIYRVTGSGLYYYTWSSAYSAAGNDVSKVVYQRAITSSGPYFSRYTGNFYNSYTEALAASLNNSSYVISTGSSSTTSDDYDAYLAWLLSQYGNSSSSSNNNGSVTIGNRTGWNAVRSYINSARSGAVYNVSMNNETTIPQAVLAALNGKNVTVNFTLANGAVVSYNGRDIVNAQDVDVALTYNTNRVPNALLNAALTQVKNAVSTSSFSMTNNSFAADTTTAIRLNQKRAGCTAKLYRYNTARNSLQLVDSSVIGETGSVSFDNVTQGGDYVVVICNN